MTSENLVEIIDLTENIKQHEAASETEIVTTVIPSEAAGSSSTETEAIATTKTDVETEVKAIATSTLFVEAETQEQIAEAANQSSAASGLEIEAEIVECSTEEPLTPAVSEISDVSKSATNSGRVTPASQSDVASVSSSEKSTPTRKRRSADLIGRQIEFDNVSSSSGSVKGTKLPNRVGIHWRKGERLEAKDFMNKWFPAKIREVNEEDMEVLIHFDGWNQRYDEWLPMTTERIRPMTRHSARKDENRKARTEFKIGERVLAKWTDCKMYEAKVTAVFPNGTVEVIFYDGFKKLVQPINLRPMPSELNNRASNMNLPPSDAPKKAKLKPGSIDSSLGSKKERLSTEGLNKSEDSKPKSKPKDQRHRTKMLVSGSMFARPSTSKPDTPQLSRAMTPVVKLGLAVTEADLTATKETETFDTEIPGTSQPTIEPSPSTSDGFITAPSVLPVPKKAFVIESDHNQYKCPFENCGKGFRKESLLDYHIKYYHINGGEPPPPAPPKKRRKTISIPSADSEQATSSGKKPAPKKQRHVSEGGVRPAKKKRHISEQSETFKRAQPVTESAGTLPVEEEKNVGKTVEEVTEEVHEQSMDTMGYLEGEEVTSPTSPDFVYEEADMVSEDMKPELKTEAPKLEPRSGSKHRRSESQDTNVTEESTDAEDYLKPDELVNCICGFYEENGLMIQCEVCMCWQHANCFGITDRTLPKVYVCYVCENPPGIRESSKYIHEQDWFKNGELAAFNYLSTPVPTEERLGSVKATHSLVADVNQLNAVLHALKLQLKILRTKDEKQLKQWHMDWDMVEFLDESLETNQSTESTEGNLNENKGGDSYVQGEGGDSGSTGDERNKPGKSSEVADNKMCQVKPETDDDIIDGNIKSFDKSAESTSNASESKTEEKDQNIKREEDKDSELMRDAKTIGPSSSVNGTLSVNGEAGPSSATEGTKASDPSESSTVNGPESETRDKVETTVAQIPSIASMVADEDPNYSDSTESALVDEDPIETCERNLIQHILRIQGEISKRMDLIEEQINILESMESKYTGIADQGLEPDLVHLKKNVKNMDYDLTKVKRMAAIQ